MGPVERSDVQLHGSTQGGWLSRAPARLVDDVTGLIAALTDAGYKRETISKSRDALAMTLDHHRVEPKRVAAEHCVYALTDYREVDRTIALARCQVR